MSYSVLRGCACDSFYEIYVLCACVCTCCFFVIILLTLLCDFAIIYQIQNKVNVLKAKVLEI